MSVIFTFGPKRATSQNEEPDHSNSGFALEGTNGAIVILIHGMTGTPSEMKFLAHYLNKKGYSIICPHLANHGKPLEVLKKTKWNEFYVSVRDIVESEKVKNNKGPIFVSGLSLGALLSLLAAYDYKDKIAGVSCLAPTLFYDGWNTPLGKYFMPLAHTPIKHFFYFKEEPPYGIRNEAIQQRIHKYYSAASLDRMENVEQYGYPYFPVTLLHQLQLLVKYLDKRLPKIKVPVQLIQAKDDDMTSPRNSKHIYDRVGSDMKEMIFLYNSYHVVSADQERGIVAEKMDNFFRRIMGSLDYASAQKLEGQR